MIKPHLLHRCTSITFTLQVVANALLLYSLARHTLTHQNKTLIEKRIQLDQNESRLTKKGAYTIPRDEDGGVMPPTSPSTTNGVRRAPPAAATPSTVNSTRKPLRYHTPDIHQEVPNRDVSPGSFL